MSNIQSAPTQVFQYPVMEHFYTLQGEGYWTGTPAYFIRLGGCDVGCHWCDVKESWPEAGHPMLSPEDLVAFIRETPARRVVITGGEPFMHDLTVLTRVLKEAGYLLHCETSGTCLLSGNWDWICFSPKKFKAPLPIWYEIADELKVIVYQNHDLEWGLGHAQRCRPETKLFYQPEWNSAHRLPAITEFVKSHPNWRISLQTHKYLQIP